MRSHVISFRLSLVLLLSCFVLLTACGQSSSPATAAKPTPPPTAALDFYGTPIVLPTSAPRRIVSLLPSTSDQRLVEGLRCLAQLIHPEKFSGALPDYCSGTV